MADIKRPATDEEKELFTNYIKLLPSVGVHGSYNEKVVNAHDYAEKNGLFNLTDVDWGGEQQRFEGQRTYFNNLTKEYSNPKNAQKLQKARDSFAKKQEKKNGGTVSSTESATTKQEAPKVEYGKLSFDEYNTDDIYDLDGPTTKELVQKGKAEGLDKDTLVSKLSNKWANSSYLQSALDEVYGTPKKNEGYKGADASMNKALTPKTEEPRPETTTDLEKGNIVNIAASPVKAFETNITDAENEGKNKTDKVLKEVKENYGVDGKTGKIKSPSIFNELINAGDSIENTFKAIGNRNNNEDIINAKEQKKVASDTLKQANKLDNYQKAMLKKANKDQEALQKEYDEAVAKKSALQQQLESMTPVDLPAEDQEIVNANNAERVEADNALQPIADEINSVTNNTELSPEEQMAQLDEIINKNGAALAEIGNTIIGIENKNLSVYKKYAEQTGNKDALKGIEMIENYQNNINQIFDMDENGNLIANLTDEGKKSLMNSIKEATDILRNDDSTLALKDAVKDMNSDVSRFVRFAIQDMAGALLLVCGFASGTPEMIKMGLDIGINRMNNAYMDAETNAKANILSATTKTVTNDITKESDANYQRTQDLASLELELAKLGLDAKKNALAMTGFKEAYDAYQEAMKGLPNTEKVAFATYVASNLGQTGWGLALTAAGLNGATIESMLKGAIGGNAMHFAEGGIIGQTEGASMGPDNTVINAREGEMVLNADQQKRLFDILDGKKAVDTKGKTGNIMDGILSRGKTQKEQPKEEVDLSKSPAMKMSKQQMLSNALSQRNPQALQNQQAPTPKAQKGWGKA